MVAGARIERASPSKATDSELAASLPCDVIAKIAEAEPRTGHGLAFFVNLENTFTDLAMGFYFLEVIALKFSLAAETVRKDGTASPAAIAGASVSKGATGTAVFRAAGRLCQLVTMPADKD